MPENYPGLLVIHDNNIFWESIFSVSPQEIAKKIRKRIRRYPFLVGIVIISSSAATFDKTNSVIDEGDYLIIQRYIYEGIKETSLFVKNTESPYLHLNKELINIFK